MSEKLLAPAWGISIAPAPALYRSVGLEPIALKPHSKRPAAPRWQKDPHLSWQWAQINANIGILGGQPSGHLLVIDIDEPGALPHLFDLDLTELARRTTIVVTPNGYHVYARKPGASSTKLPDGAGDIKAKGGYVVAPPSIHPDGSRYRFLSLPDRIARFTELCPTFDPAPSTGRTEASTQRPAAAGCVEASTTPASPDLESRVEAFVGEQAPRFRRRVARLRYGTVDDRSGAEFMLAKGMAEAEFTFNEIRAILTSWGSKTREREDAYLNRTVTRAMRYADREPPGQGGGDG